MSSLAVDDKRGPNPEDARREDVLRRVLEQMQDAPFRCTNCITIQSIFLFMEFSRVVAGAMEAAENAVSSRFVA